MKLPRRVPWLSLQELDQVCAWIYTDENDIDAKIKAVNRLAAWKNITSLPHALESTHGLLISIIQDANSSTLRTVSTLPLRQSYATALIRLVNGLVDPLQVGAYARSISSIASQLGLPPWLVEVRHAATHEDLPSLEILREAARTAMTWLLNNYFLPTLYPATQPTAKTPPLRSLAPALKEYKNLLKITTRDASLRSQYQTEVTRILRDVERWISEAKVASNVLSGAFDWDASPGANDSEADPRERWALERFCDTLLDKGMLVPLSKRKRTVNSAFAPPPSSVAIWTPLLSHVQSLHPSLPSVLVNKIVSYLLPKEPIPQETQDGNLSLREDSYKRDTSYELCLVSWAKHILDVSESSSIHEDAETILDRHEVVATIISTLGPHQAHNANEENGIRALLTALCSDHQDLQDLALSLTSPTAPVSSISNSVWNERDLESMNKRLQNLMTSIRSTDATRPTVDNGSNPLPRLSSPPPTATSMDVEEPKGPLTLSEEGSPELPPGWRKLSERDGWRPSPIGIYVGSAVSRLH